MKTDTTIKSPAYARDAVLKYTARRRAEGRSFGVYAMTFGCQQNEADSERLLGLAISMGFVPVDDAAEAALILVNTCAIREHAEQKALSIIGGLKHYKEKDPEILIGVVGCK